MPERLWHTLSELKDLFGTATENLKETIFTSFRLLSVARKKLAPSERNPQIFVEESSFISTRIIFGADRYVVYQETEISLNALWRLCGVQFLLKWLTSIIFNGDGWNQSSLNYT